MQQNIHIITKIILILAIIFCVLALILPLSGFNLHQIRDSTITITDSGTNLYTWGIHYTNQGKWFFYYAPQEFLEIQSDSEISGMQDWTIRFLAMAYLMLLVFPMTVISIILGVFAVRNIAKRESKASIYAGIILLFGISFIVLFGVTMTDIINSMISTSPYVSFSIHQNFSWGFFLIIASSILFIIGYYMQKTLFKPKSIVEAGAEEERSGDIVKDIQDQKDN